jgi:hypothetical protein
MEVKGAVSGMSSNRAAVSAKKPKRKLSEAVQIIKTAAAIQRENLKRKVAKSK